MLTPSAKAPLLLEGEGKVLACSTTATPAKVLIRCGEGKISNSRT